MAQKKHGRNMYVPGSVVDHLDDIMREYRVPKKNEAFQKMTNYSEIGREFERFSKSLNIFGPNPWERKRKDGS